MIYIIPQTDFCMQVFFKKYPNGTQFHGEISGFADFGSQTQSPGNRLWIYSDRRCGRRQYPKDKDLYRKTGS